MVDGSVRLPLRNMYKSTEMRKTGTVVGGPLRAAAPPAAAPCLRLPENHSQ